MAALGVEDYRRLEAPLSSPPQQRAQSQPFRDFVSSSFISNLYKPKSIEENAEEKRQRLKKVEEELFAFIDNQHTPTESLQPHVIRQHNHETHANVEAKAHPYAHHTAEGEEIDLNRTLDSISAIGATRADQQSSKLPTWIWILVAIVLVSSTWLVPWVSILENFLRVVENMGMWGNVILCIGFIVVSFPFTFGYSALVLSAGFLYGFGIGIVTSAFGSAAGSSAAFWVCRKLAARTIGPYILNNKVGLALSAMGHSGWKGAFLSRLVPFPFGISNAILALSTIQYQTFAVASFLGLLPFQASLVYLGTTLRDITEVLSGDATLGVWQWVIIVLQVVCIIISLVYFYKLIKNYPTNTNNNIANNTTDSSANNNTAIDLLSTKNLP